MKRVLFVAYYFPPLGGIGSVRTYSFATHLADFGWDVTVLAPRAGSYFRDSSLQFPEDHVVRTRAIELSRVGKQVLRTGGDDITEARVTGVRAALRRLVREQLYFPDAQIGWYPAAVTTAARELATTRYDAIFSTSFPVTAHLIARSLHRRWGTPWVAEFRDPWSARLEPGSLACSRAIGLERRLSGEASAIVTVSGSWGEMFAAEWQREITVITNGHDGQAPPGLKQPETRIRLGYLGTYYPASQDLEVIWTAIGNLNRTQQHAVHEIRFIGAQNASVEDTVSAHGLGNLLSFTGFLPHSAVTAELSQCAALLVAGPTAEGRLGKGVIAAKVFEYLASGKPIIYVGDPSADAAQMLRGFDGTYIVESGDLSAAVEALVEAPTARFERNTDKLSRHALTGRLAALLDSVCE